MAKTEAPVSANSLETSLEHAKGSTPPETTAETKPVSTDERYPFAETSASWALYGSKYNPNVDLTDRVAGVVIFFFQYAIYGILVNDSVQNFKADQVAVTIQHGACGNAIDASSDLQLSDLKCDASSPTGSGVFVTMAMAAFFLVPDMVDSVRALYATCSFFSLLAFTEVFLSWFTCVLVASQKLYIGAVPDAISDSVGLLFVHDLGGRVYQGVITNKIDHKVYFSVFTVFLVAGCFTALAAPAMLG